MNYILQNNAPNNTTLSGFNRKRAVFNIWDHDPHLHIFMWNKTGVHLKIRFHNVFSTLINPNAGIKVELLLLTHTSLKLPKQFLFPGNLNFDCSLTRWNNTHCSLTQLLQNLFYGGTSHFGWAGCLFPAHLGASWAHGLQRDNTGNCMDHFIVLSCLFSYVGLSLSLTFQRSLTLRTLWILVIK